MDVTTEQRVDGNTTANGVGVLGCLLPYPVTSRRNPSPHLPVGFRQGAQNTVRAPLVVLLKTQLSRDRKG